jgi:hypothetical protein
MKLDPDEMNLDQEESGFESCSEDVELLPLPLNTLITRIRTSGNKRAKHAQCRLPSGEEERGTQGNTGGNGGDDDGTGDVASVLAVSSYACLVFIILNGILTASVSTSALAFAPTEAESLSMLHAGKEFIEENICLKS